MWVFLDKVENGLHTDVGKKNMIETVVCMRTKSETNLTHVFSISVPRKPKKVKIQRMATAYK